MIYPENIWPENVEALILKDCTRRAQELRKRNPHAADILLGGLIANSRTEVILGRGLGEECESPIEMFFTAAFTVYGRDLIARKTENAFDVDLYPQYKIKTEKHTYRLDFMLDLYSEKEEHKFAIECDGHNYHEKTKEQAANDRSRERALMREGFTVIRFTGSELHNKPFKCMEEMADVVEKTVKSHSTEKLRDELFKELEKL